MLCLVHLGLCSAVHGYRRPPQHHVPALSPLPHRAHWCAICPSNLHLCCVTHSVLCVWNCPAQRRSDCAFGSHRRRLCAIQSLATFAVRSTREGPLTDSMVCLLALQWFWPTPRPSVFRCTSSFLLCWAASRKPLGYVHTQLVRFAECCSWLVLQETNTEHAFLSMAATITVPAYSAMRAFCECNRRNASALCAADPADLVRLGCSFSVVFVCASVCSLRLCGAHNRSLLGVRRSHRAAPGNRRGGSRLCSVRRLSSSCVFSAECA